MHELSLATALVEQVETILVREGASRVVSIILEMGSLSGVERHSFEFCFPLAAQGTKVEGAELHIEEVRAEVSCRSCGRTSQPEFPAMVCTACGAVDVSVVKGRDFILKSLEVQ